VLEIAQHDDVLSLRLTWPRSRMVGYAVHAYVVRGVLVDTGFPGVARDVLAFARERRIRGALVTHQHEDHAGNVEALARAGVPLGIDGRTLEVVSRPHPIGFYRHFTWRAMPVLRARFEPFTDPSLPLLPTPGHSDDHHVVWDETSDTMFAGDLFLGVKVRVAGPSRTRVARSRRCVRSSHDVPGACSARTGASSPIRWVP
jgi:glyoxylase-like metal-dependent hydrolase (beta-lactamase superfamily II)